MKEWDLNWKGILVIIGVVEFSCFMSSTSSTSYPTMVIPQTMIVSGRILPNLGEMMQHVLWSWPMLS